MRTSWWHIEHQTGKQAYHSAFSVHVDGMPPKQIYPTDSGNRYRLAALAALALFVFVCVAYCWRYAVLCVSLVTHRSECSSFVVFAFLASVAPCLLFFFSFLPAKTPVTVIFVATWHRAEWRMQSLKLMPRHRFIINIAILFYTLAIKSSSVLAAMHHGISTAPHKIVSHSNSIKNLDGSAVRCGSVGRHTCIHIATFIPAIIGKKKKKKISLP